MTGPGVAATGGLPALGIPQGRSRGYAITQFRDTADAVVDTGYPVRVEGICRSAADHGEMAAL